MPLFQVTTARPVGVITSRMRAEKLELTAFGSTGTAVPQPPLALNTL